MVKQALPQKIIKGLSSQTFLYLIILLLSFQAVWIAFSFRFPMIFDEGNHFQLITFYSHQNLPFITGQPEAYDNLGALSAGANYIYHYIFSFPYRIVHMFTDSAAIIIVFLRLLNVFLFAFGLWVYSRAFKKVGIGQQYINAGLLIFVLLPITPLLASHINYDNLLFLVTGIFLLAGINTLKSKKLLDINTVWLISVGLFGMSIKLTFAPIFMAGLIYILFAKLKPRLKAKDSSSLKTELKNNFRAISKRSLVLASLLGVISILFILPTYVGNYVKYQKLIPECAQVLGVERCQANRFVVRKQKAIETKNSLPADFQNFPLDWYQRMTNFGQTGIKIGDEGARWSNAPLLVGLLITNGLVIGLGILLYAWRSLNKNSGWYFLIICGLAVVGSIFVFNLKVYSAYHQALASNPRYLITALPIFIVMYVVATAFVLRGNPKVKLAILSVVTLIFMLGGGLATSILRSDDTWYWQNQRIIQANHTAKRILQKVNLHQN